MKGITWNQFKLGLLLNLTAYAYIPGMPTWFYLAAIFSVTSYYGVGYRERLRLRLRLTR